MIVKLFARHPGLNPAIKVLVIDLKDRIHPRKIDADPAAKGRDMPLKRRSGAKRHDRHVMFGAKCDDLRDFFGRGGKHHRIGRGRRVPAFILAMLFKNSSSSRQAIPQQIAQARDQAFGGFNAVILTMGHDVPLGLWWQPAAITRYQTGRMPGRSKSGPSLIRYFQNWYYLLPRNAKNRP